jgi:protease-4
LKKALLACAALAALAIAAGLLVRAAGGGLPSRTVLDVNLEAAYPEAVPQDALASLLSPSRLTLADLVGAIDRGAEDKSVAGLYARVGSSSLGPAQVQEVRDAVARFRAKKKFAVAFSESFGESGGGNGPYYLATAFDEIWLQPSGDVWLTGVALESPFLRGTFDKLGVVPSFGQRYEYKNAVNFFTEKGFTAAHREASEKLKDAWFAQMVRGIAAGRNLPPESVREAVDRGPFLGREALDAKLVDGLAYRDEVVDGVKRRAGAGAELVPLSRYRERMGEPLLRPRQTLALVYGVGEVHRGRSTYNPITDSPTMGSESVSAALRAAARDADVRAIVFRVDSPGGSYVASDTIWREVGSARKAGKPVVVSMGDVAGSGGYFVAMNADKIVAQPATITGSIGVFAGKFVLSGLFDKIGISFDEVHSGQNALLWDVNRDFSPSEKARFEAWLDRVYEDFTSKVAEGRHLPKEKVLQIAKGRIWSGEDAKQLGLVDELGGLDTAVRLAKKAARIAESEPVRLEIYPKPKTFFQTLVARLERRPETETAAEPGAELLAATVRALQPYVRALRALGLGPERGVLSMPPLAGHF